MFKTLFFIRPSWEKMGQCNDEILHSICGLINIDNPKRILCCRPIGYFIHYILENSGRYACTRLAHVRVREKCITYETFQLARFCEVGRLTDCERASERERMNGRPRSSTALFIYYVPSHSLAPQFASSDTVLMSFKNVATCELFWTLARAHIYQMAIPLSNSVLFWSDFAGFIGEIFCAVTFFCVYLEGTSKIYTRVRVSWKFL